MGAGRILAWAARRERNEAKYHALMVRDVEQQYEDLLYRPYRSIGAGRIERSLMTIPIYKKDVERILSSEYCPDWIKTDWFSRM